MGELLETGKRHEGELLTLLRIEAAVNGLWTDYCGSDVERIMQED